MPDVPPNALFDPGPSGRRPLRGRGATPVREHVQTLDAPNPYGRVQLRYRYRPLRHWTPEQIDFAERAALYYFRRIGGYAIASDLILRLLIEAYDFLATDAGDMSVPPATLIKWAIDAKADSLKGRDVDEAHGKRLYRGSIAGFLEPNKLTYWLEQSTSFLDRRRVVAAANRHKQLTPEQFADEVVAGTEKLQRRDREMTAEELRLLAFWDSLQPIQRMKSVVSAGEGRTLSNASRRAPGPPSNQSQIEFERDLARVRCAKWARDAWPAAWSAFARCRDGESPVDPLAEPPAEPPVCHSERSEESPHASKHEAAASETTTLTGEVVP